MSGKKVAMIAIPVVAIVALAAIFVVPALQMPGNGKVVPPNEECSAISGKVKTILVNIDGQNDETRMSAASTLVEQYCQRPQLVQEVSAMAYPGAGLVAYACDAASGRTGDGALQGIIGSSSQLYCDGAFIAIFEESENIIVSAEGYLDEVLQGEDEDSPEAEDDPGASGNFTSTVNIEEVQSKVDEITDIARKAKSQLRSQQFYEAAKSLDRAAKLLDNLA